MDNNYEIKKYEIVIKINHIKYIILKYKKI